MKPGDLVIFNRHNNFYKDLYGYGLITSLCSHSGHSGEGSYCWVLFFRTKTNGEWVPCKKWCEVKDLELISDYR